MMIKSAPWLLQIFQVFYSPLHFIFFIVIQKLDVAKALYACSWYRLPINLSKNVSTALNLIQNAPVPSIGPLGKLDYTAANAVRMVLLCSAQ